MKFHLIAIGGTGMGSLAGLLKASGHEVRGSDEKLYPPMSDQLRELGIPVFEGFRGENLDWGPDRVVVGNVCRRDHVEVVEAQARGWALTSFPALLGEVFLERSDRQSLVVAGTHGKTTTSSLLAHVLCDSGRDPSFLVGGVPLNFGKGWRLGNGSHFVVEGDEYDSAFFDKGSKFFHYRPRVAILTSVELDHVDIFDSMAAVRRAFAQFVALIPKDGLLVAASSSQEVLAIAKEAGCKVETYAASARSAEGTRPTWHAEPRPGRVPGRTSLTVTRSGEFFGTFEVGLFGDHNVENALAVVAVAAFLGLSAAEISRAFARFLGVKRRQELCGTAAGVAVIDDYAHHPTAVHETILALRNRYPSGKLLCIYHPRSATSRRATFQKEFAGALSKADEAVIAPLHAPAAVPEALRFDIDQLVGDLRSQGTVARALPDVDSIVNHVSERVKPGDTIVVFSSGDFGGIHKKLLYRLGDPIMPARSEDMPRVRAILGEIGLISADLTDDRFGDVLVVVDETGIVGCVAVEIFDEAAILRSLAVTLERRGQGIGWMLADSAVAKARASGVRRMYLLTEHASDFFAEKFGFNPIDRASVDVTVSESAHFRESAQHATTMRLDL